MRKHLIMAACAVAAAALLAACSSSSSGGSASSSAGTGGGTPSYVTDAQKAVTAAETIPTTIPSATLGPVKVKAGSTIYHIACNLALEGCSNVANAMKAAATTAGIGFKICDGGTTADTITACFNQAVNAKPDVIIVNGIGADAAANGYAEAAAAKIPVIGSFTGNTPGAVPGVVTEVAGTACTNEGTILGQFVIADSNGKGNSLFVGTKTYACNVQRLAGYQAAMQACTTCTAKSLDFAIDSLQTTLPQQISSGLTANANVNYVAGTFDAVALAATDQIRQSGKTNIKVVGFDANAPNLQLIAKGDIQVADITTGSEDAGWAAVDAAIRVIAGQTLPNSINVSTVLITKNNAPTIGAVFKGATGYVNQFKTLWGVS